MLSREDIIIGGYEVIWNTAFREIIILKKDSRCSSNKKVIHKRLIMKNLKDGNMKRELVISVIIRGKRKTMQVGRLVYAWFNNNIPDNFDITFLDGNSLNLDPSNLSIIPRREALANRLLGK